LFFWGTAQTALDERPQFTFVSGGVFPIRAVFDGSYPDGKFPWSVTSINLEKITYDYFQGKPPEL
jgi:hypothetical protein